MNTLDLIEALRADIRRELKEEILTELQPIIERQLYANIFTFKEATQFLKISASTLRRMVADNELPHFRLRRQIYFRQTDLLNWIDERIITGRQTEVIENVEQ